MVKKWDLGNHEIFVNPKEYKIDGKTYYRVTATLGVIAKHRLRNWMEKTGYAEATKILETRQNIGIQIHKLIEWDLTGKQFNLGNYEKEIQNGILEFAEFKTQAKLKPEALEQSIWSNQYGYAGTADYIGKYTTPIKYLATEIINHKKTKNPKFTKSTFVIGDWKTGKDIYPSYWLQVAAYAIAFEELTGIKPQGAFIARIRDGKIQVKEKTIEELKAEFPVYKAVLELYEWKYKLGKYKFLKKRCN